MRFFTSRSPLLPISRKFSVYPHIPELMAVWKLQAALFEKKFSEAQEHANDLIEMYNEPEDKSCEGDPLNCKHTDSYRLQNLSPASFGCYLEHELQQIDYSAIQVAKLLENPSLCITLLGELEDALNKDGYDNTLDPEKGFYVTNKLWVPPKLPTQHISLAKPNRLLSLIQEKLPFIRNRLPEKFFNLTIKNNASFFKNDDIFYGYYSRLLQCYILACAYEKKLIYFDNLTLEEFLATCEKVNYNYYGEIIPLKSALFNQQEYVSATTPLKTIKKNFSDPRRMNSVILSSKELPRLRSFLLHHAWYSSLSAYHKRFSYELLVCAIASSNYAFYDQIYELMLTSHPNSFASTNPSLPTKTNTSAETPTKTAGIGRPS